MDLTQLLQNSSGADRALGAQAEQQLKELERQNPALYMALLTEELASEQKPIVTRQTAGLILKNMLDARDMAKRLELHEQWVKVDANAKAQIKAKAAATLGSQAIQAARTAAQVVARIALIELERNEWPDLIQHLLNNMVQPNNNLKIASLETLGYICDDIEPEVLGGQSNQILTAVIQGMRKDEPEVAVRNAATKSLNNALIFIKNNFQKPEERNFIMQTICEACVAAGVPAQGNHTDQLKLSAFECLVRVADLYYDYLTDYMNALAELTFSAIKKEEESIGRMAIEFWCTICDEEIELIAEEEECAENQQPPPQRRCLQIIKTALQSLTPLLLEKLTTIEDDEDDDNIATSAGTCLTLIANTVRDDAVQVVLPFVQLNIQSAEWKNKASAIHAFGFILEGPSDEKLQPLVSQALPVIMQSLKDQHARVKDCTAWTLSRVCEFHAGITVPYLDQLFQLLIEALADEPRVANNSCWAIHFLAREFGGEDQETSQLSRYFQAVIHALLTCTQRPDADEANLRISSYEVTNTMIQNGANDTIPITTSLINDLLGRLYKTFSMEVMSAEDREEQSELQGLLCGVFSSITNRLGDAIQPHVDQMMKLFVEVFKQQSATVHEEALMATSSVATAIGNKFAPYVPHVMPYLKLGLKNHAEYEVCGVSVGLLGDLCRVLEKNFAGYAAEIVQILIEDLQSASLDNSVKPAILSVFGDIAMAIGAAFEPYLNTVIVLLYQASALQVDMDDPEMVEYVNEIRESVLDAYTGILQGFSDDQKQAVLVPYLETIFYLVKLVSEDSQREEGVTRAAVALIGDLATSLQGACAPHVRNPSIALMVRQAIDSGEIAEAEYTSKALQKFVPS